MLVESPSLLSLFSHPIQRAFMLNEIKVPRPYVFLLFCHIAQELFSILEIAPYQILIRKKPGLLPWEDWTNQRPF